MSKKSNKGVVTAAEKPEVPTTVVATSAQQQVPAKTEQKKKKNSKPNGFVAFFKKVFGWIGKKCKDMWSELKKVTWPKMPKVVRQTGVVLGVILVFVIFITVVDFGLQALLSLVTG